MNPFSAHTAEIRRLVSLWEPKLLALPEDVISTRFNSQHRTIKMILGHLCDSTSVPSPLHFPDYANLGNNDRWIALQDYQHEPWQDLVSLFKSTTIHFAYVADRVDEIKLGNVWLNALAEPITLEEMIRDYGRHLGESEELINNCDC
ncbi:MAG TPA: DinB family protein [Bacteroidales bacterium]|nr:DinB family protein [Bacteroidales bacterium]